jgi:hypothetical protein
VNKTFLASSILYQMFAVCAVLSYRAVTQIIFEAAPVGIAGTAVIFHTGEC